jgi:hypothetical protein
LFFANGEEGLKSQFWQKVMIEAAVVAWLKRIILLTSQMSMFYKGSPGRAAMEHCSLNRIKPI